MSEVYSVVYGPLITEKSAMQQDENIFVFRVGSKANKIQIKKAIEDLFGVSVEGVRTVQVRGKNKRFGRHFGKRQNWKKAYVTLAEGDSINVYENV